MDISIVTIAFKGYGKFLRQWCYYMSQLNTPAKEYIAVLGSGHGCKDIEVCKALLPNLKVIYDDNQIPLLGPLRNKAIQATKSEWIMFLSVDDMILPHAIDEFKKVQKGADYICISWLSTEIGNFNKTGYHKAITPIDMARAGGRGFIIGHSPFKRWIWEAKPYQHHDYVNYPFLAGAIALDAEFVKVMKPCTVYLRRPDSHARRVLPRRSEKKQAVYQKR